VVRVDSVSLTYVMESVFNLAAIHFMYKYLCVCECACVRVCVCIYISICKHRQWRDRSSTKQCYVCVCVCMCVYDKHYLGHSSAAYLGALCVRECMRVFIMYIILHTHAYTHTGNAGATFQLSSVPGRSHCVTRGCERARRHCCMLVGHVCSWRKSCLHTKHMYAFIYVFTYICFYVSIFNVSLYVYMYIHMYMCVHGVAACWLGMIAPGESHTFICIYIFYYVHVYVFICNVFWHVDVF